MTTFQNREIERYLQMPKDFVGPEKADDLFSLSLNIISGPESFRNLFVAGSAMAESGLIGTESSVEDRHARIETAKDLWIKAQDSFLFNHIADDWSESKLFVMPDRVQTQLMYLDLYHDMVDGFVEETTLGFLHANLVSLARRNKELHDGAEQEGDVSGFIARRGLGYELNSLMSVTRLTCPSLFAIPSTARADHGGFMGEHTHDARLIQQTHGTINWCVPIEVKPTSYHSDDYIVPLLSGREELLLPSSINPLELVLFMEAEINGTITAQQREELDTITSRILGIARDYRGRCELEQLINIA